MPEKENSPKHEKKIIIEPKKINTELGKIEKIRNWEIADTSSTSIIKKSQDQDRSSKNNSNDTD